MCGDVLHKLSNIGRGVAGIWALFGLARTGLRVIRAAVRAERARQLAAEELTSELERVNKNPRASGEARPGGGRGNDLPS